MLFSFSPEGIFAAQIPLECFFYPQFPSNLPCLLRDPNAPFLACRGEQGTQCGQSQLSPVWNPEAISRRGKSRAACFRAESIHPQEQREPNSLLCLAASPSLASTKGIDWDSAAGKSSSTAEEGLREEREKGFAAKPSQLAQPPEVSASSL